MMNPVQFAMSMIQQNSQVMNNPMAQNYIGVIQSGDAQKGRQLAENICKSYGVSPQQAMQQAKQFPWFFSRILLFIFGLGAKEVLL